jgi:MFS family permease
VFVVGGTFAPFFYAYLSDKLEPYNWKAKAYLASFQALFAAACYFFIFFFFRNFYFAVIFIVLEEFFAEGIVAPSLSMMTLTCPRGQDGNLMGLYMIVTSVAILIMTFAYGYILKADDP